MLTAAAAPSTATNLVGIALLVILFVAGAVFSIGAFTIGRALVSHFRTGQPKGTRVEDEKGEWKPRTRTRFGNPSWQSATLWLFGVTILFAALTLLSDTSSNSAGHITNTVLFTDLSAVGTLLGGLAAVTVCVAGYFRRHKNSAQQSNAEVLNAAIDHISHSLEPGDISALAELARALNGRDASDDFSQLTISSSSDKNDQAEDNDGKDNEDPCAPRRMEPRQGIND